MCILPVFRSDSVHLFRNGESIQNIGAHMRLCTTGDLIGTPSALVSIVFCCFICKESDLFRRGFVTYVRPIFEFKHIHPPSSPSSPPDNIRVMVIVWRFRGNIIRTAVCWIVWHNVHSQQHTYVSSSYRSNRLGLSHSDPCAVRRRGCLELCYCNMVEWFWWDSSLMLMTSWFASVLWHCWFGHLACKTRPVMTYYMSSGTLNPSHIQIHRRWIFRHVRGYSLAL